ncbi:formate dehydrogenase subunit gamma [Pseudogemmobacter faecipullorum]|uniref:Formate dehydrogenase subunit gamma n=1 Tax=Pseudogemmobacter faecipullorum TaxID=2755041 RepID=A0ABS8CLB8_9RHOB|nr:formate dehydrogenase subunit gamma [Pseudogemmobacter faecipullorum]MCB5410174.1 formate dehydrogenase subunit gamma [Pseudogemmobacter faecipullorum]
MQRKFSAPGDHIESARPVTVSRYRGFTRLNHWVTALCMIVLILTGLAFFHPALYPLTGLFGGGQVARWLHPVTGIVLFFSFVLLFLQMWKLNLPRREDATWMARIGDVVAGHEERLPELGKYNAGQKFVFWAMTVLILVLILTGFMIWEAQVVLWQDYAPWAATIPARRIAVLIHALSAVGIILIFILHVYAAIWTRGTLRAMTTGSVTGGWAFRHHRKWLRELASRSDRAGN